MRGPSPASAAAPEPSGRRLFVFSGGFVWQRRVRRILSLAGYRIALGRPGADDLVGVWGNTPVSARGRRVAEATGARILTVEDAFLRSLHPGRSGAPPLGLLIDDQGLHFDGSRPSRLETILATHPLDDTALLNRAREGIWRMRATHLSKYSATDPDAPVPDPGYVLVIDQTEGDASVRASGGNKARFAEMLTEARLEHPGARIVVKTHPETARGLRGGHFGDALSEGVSLYSGPASPWALLEGAVAVYTLSSQMGFEAILAGHRPVVFGQPFYAGWGLTDDRAPVDRRQRRLTRAQLFAGAMILAPTWYDPYRDRLATFEDALGAMEAQARAWREDRAGWVASGMRLWKRPTLRRFYGQTNGVRFAQAPRADRLAAHSGALRMGWASTAEPGAIRVEDGLLRSNGLGAQLVSPLSLVADDLSIYYDPTRESRLERLIISAAGLPDTALERANRLIGLLNRAGLSKYNLPEGTLPKIPEGRRVLVVGQVEDDASIRLGAGQIATNRGLLEAARAALPGAVLLWKPHPDVEAGLRPGAVEDAAALCDVVLSNVNASQAIAMADEVWTMTSSLGFEALLRGRKVTCLGAPFYAGWGLTTDPGPTPDRRRAARPSLTALTHAVLIAYPRYHDPVSNLPCPVEIAVARLSDGTPSPRGTGLRLLAKAQGVLASQPWLWR